MIQQKDGRCILENSSVPLSEEQLSAALDGGLIGVNGTKYYCVSAPMNILPYTGLVLINNDALMLPPSLYVSCDGDRFRRAAGKLSPSGALKL